MFPITHDARDSYVRDTDGRIADESLSEERGASKRGHLLRFSSTGDLLDLI
ncbi:MAG: hypothetical protein ABI923_05730 [bacterium]